MRYTKIALLIFGLGTILGLVIVVGEFSRWERVASAVMALGLVLIPLALFADGRGMALLAWLAARFSRRGRKKPRPRSRSSAPRRKQPARSAGRPAARRRSPKRSQ